MAMLSDIMQALATLELSANAPAGEKPLTNISDEPQDALDLFPTMVNWETRTTFLREPGQGTFGLGVPQQITHYVNAALALAPQDGKYSTRSKRLWFETIFDLFRQNPTLSGVCGGAYLDDVDHQAARLQGGVEYPGFTLHLHILATG